MRTKKLLALGLSLLLMSGMTINTKAAFNRSYTAPKGTPTVDAEVDDVWATAPWTKVDKPHNGEAATDSVIRVKLLWDETHLYFLADVYDTGENKRNDIIEVYLDQNKDKATGYAADDTHTRFYVAGGVVQGDPSVTGQNAQVDAPSAAKSLGDNKYIIEGALAWPNGSAAVGDEMGLEFMYNDGSVFEAFVGAYRWNVDTTKDDEPPYAGTSAFGTLTLAKAGDPLPEDTYVEGEGETKTDESTGEKADVDQDADVDADAPDNTWFVVGGIAAAVVIIAAVIAVVARKKE